MDKVCNTEKDKDTKLNPHTAGKCLTLGSIVYSIQCSSLHLEIVSRGGEMGECEVEGQGGGGENFIACGIFGIFDASGGFSACQYL